MDPAFQEIQQLCLKKAKEALENDAAPEIETAKEFMEIAGSIEMLNVQWAAQNRRFASGGTRGMQS